MVEIVRLELLPEEGLRALEDFVLKGFRPELQRPLRRYHLVEFRGRWVLTKHGQHVARHYKLLER